ncbi:hypothetical protein GCM10010483_47180 [Actinokineospora diospyrosa]
MHMGFSGGTGDIGPVIRSRGLLNLLLTTRHNKDSQRAATFGKPSHRRPPPTPATAALTVSDGGPPHFHRAARAG